LNATPTTARRIDAAALAGALRSGIHRVILEQETLNRINVFPVADGDTGTNLSLSLGAALDTLTRPGAEALGEFLARVADVLLDGARGNSGAILAQFFQGVSDSAENLHEFTSGSLAHAVETGSRYAHDALSNPREGTILSVIAVFAESLTDAAADGQNAAIGDVLTRATDAAKVALARTQDQLDVLRKAGVVDAGARGFVVLVEGMADFVARGEVTEAPELAQSIVRESPMNTAGSAGDLAYRFCTECIVTGSDIDRRKLRERLSALGDSLVLAGTKRKAKIHIHVNEPEHVFDVVREYGELSGLKADDMHRQQHSTHDDKVRFAVITDSAADIPDEDMERLDIHMVPCRIQFGDRSYLDKVSITTAEFFEELATNPAAPTTSQPSPGDFRRQYQYLATHFPDVISINLTGAVSGTLQAAESAASRTNAPGWIHVVDSRNASLGQGQLAVFAAECAAAGLDIETTLDAVRQMVNVTTSFALVRDLSYAVRGGRVPASRKLAADWLGLTPVLQTRTDGSVATGGLLPGRRNLLPKFARFIARRCNPDADLHLAFGHALCEDDARSLDAMLRDILPNVKKSSLTGLGSALGVHGGPGSLVVGVQEFRAPAAFAGKLS
jgi:DegV family protein with EDD domain